MCVAVMSPERMDARIKAGLQMSTTIAEICFEVRELTFPRFSKKIPMATRMQMTPICCKITDRLIENSRLTNSAYGAGGETFERPGGTPPTV